MSPIQIRVRTGTPERMLASRREFDPRRNHAMNFDKRGSASIIFDPFLRGAIVLILLRQVYLLGISILSGTQHILWERAHFYLKKPTSGCRSRLVFPSASFSYRQVQKQEIHSTSPVLNLCLLLWNMQIREITCFKQQMHERFLRYASLLLKQIQEILQMWL